MVPTTTQQNQSNIAELINKTFHSLHHYRSKRCFLWLIGYSVLINLRVWIFWVVLYNPLYQVNVDIGKIL